MRNMHSAAAVLIFYINSINSYCVACELKSGSSILLKSKKFSDMNFYKKLAHTRQVVCWGAYARGSGQLPLYPLL